MNVKIGKHIKELRNRDGVTQDALAEALGVTGQAISKWEQGQGYPEVEKLLLLSSKLNVSLDDLMEHLDGNEPPSAEERGIRAK